MFIHESIVLTLFFMVFLRYCIYGKLIRKRIPPNPQPSSPTPSLYFQKHIQTFAVYNLAPNTLTLI